MAADRKSSPPISRGLRRANAVPKPVAYALPVLLFVTFPLSVVGGPMLAGAFWIAVATQMQRGTLGRPAPRYREAGALR